MGLLTLCLAFFFSYLTKGGGRRKGVGEAKRRENENYKGRCKRRDKKRKI
jgi:hypothetical protein